MNFEKNRITGAGMAAEKNNAAQFRKTTQPLLPLTDSGSEKNGYCIFPSFKSGFKVYEGFRSLAETIIDEKTVVIDGYGGVRWDHFRAHLSAALDVVGKKVEWRYVGDCLKPPAVVDAMIADSLNGDDPVFGKRYTGQLADFYDAALLEKLQPDTDADLCIVYGTGAALANRTAQLIYLDVPKNEIQYRMRAGAVNNMGGTPLTLNTQQYKRFYFVDWPVLNKHKQALLKRIDYIADEQRITHITWMHGSDFRASLGKMLEQPFRARPWFEAGVWGGNWMKAHIDGLNKAEVNYAWSFELITPENGIVIAGDSNLLEVSFDFLLYYNNEKLLGKAAHRFGMEFPIRFDFLDTFDGGNLSVQCHPRPAYIQEHFGENFTQDETYYILDCKPGANVYLGFQDNIDPVEFKTALLNAQCDGVEMQAEKYVQKLDAQKHDLFLIPGGTIHASGKNNMVLEISSTPYIFTFKMYDWQRLDLSGQPRPINIEHAFNNLYFDRKGEYVQQQLISKPFVVSEWPGGRCLKLPTHQEHFYTIDRYEFSGVVKIDTNEQCHICMLVEGQTIEVAVDNTSCVFNYAETFVIPANVRSYQLKQSGNQKVFVVIAYVKNECC